MEASIVKNIPKTAASVEIGRTYPMIDKYCPAVVIAEVIPELSDTSDKKRSGYVAAQMKAYKIERMPRVIIDPLF